jgi:hypothetical protein
MQTSRARRIQTSRPKGSGRLSDFSYAAARATAETAWLAVAIPAWNMRNLTVRATSRRQRSGGAYTVDAPYEVDDMPGGRR